MRKTLTTLALTLIVYAADAQTAWTSTTKMKGTIGKYEIMMTLAIPYGGGAQCFTAGEYYYLSTKKMIDLCSYDDKRIIETVNGKKTGYFVIPDWDKNVGQTVLGTWYSMDRKRSYPVRLRVVEKSE